jgi:hypothetical protein
VRVWTTEERGARSGRRGRVKFNLVYVTPEVEDTFFLVFGGEHSDRTLTVRFRRPYILLRRISTRIRITRYARIRLLRAPWH